MTGLDDGLWLRWCIPGRAGDAAAGNGLEVTKEMGPSPLCPIGRIPRIDSGACTQHAEKGMLRGIDHDPGMSAPDGQVARLRTCYSTEFVSPCVEVGRWGIVIGEAGALVNGVDQVRAIGRVTAGMQCGMNDRQSFMPSQ